MIFLTGGINRELAYSTSRLMVANMNKSINNNQKSIGFVQSPKKEKQTCDHLPDISKGHGTQVIFKAFGPVVSNINVYLNNNKISSRPDKQNHPMREANFFRSYNTPRSIQHIETRIIKFKHKKQLLPFSHQHSR